MAGTLPWAVMLTAAGGLAWWLLAREAAAGRWLLAALLIGHGLVHLLFAVPGPAAAEGGADGWPFDIGRSWLITAGGVDASVVRIVVAGLVAIAVSGFAVAGLATVGIVVPAGWWPAAVSLAAIASAAALIVCFDPQLVLGLGMDGVLLWVAASRAWVP